LRRNYHPLQQPTDEHHPLEKPPLSGPLALLPLLRFLLEHNVNLIIAQANICQPLTKWVAVAVAWALGGGFSFGNGGSWIGCQLCC